MHGALCISSPKHQHTQSRRLCFNCPVGPDDWLNTSKIRSSRRAEFGCGMKQMARSQTCALFDEIRDAISCHAGLATLSALDQRELHVWRAIKITHDRLGFHKCDNFFAAPRHQNRLRIVPSLKSPASASSKFSYRSSLRTRNRQTAFSDLAVVKKEKKSES